MQEWWPSRPYRPPYLDETRLVSTKGPSRGGKQLRFLERAKSSIFHPTSVFHPISPSTT